jgi:ribosomal protein S18 acetylase RimI-like enzyme
MIIRPYTEEDYQFTHDLHRKNMIRFVDRYWGGWDSGVYRRDVCSEKTWIVEVDGQRAGFFVLVLETIAHLSNIQIDPSFRGRGLGTRVLRHCEAESIKRGFDALYLESFLENRARHLYERLGYTTYEITESHFKMKKDLGKEDGRHFREE